MCIHPVTKYAFQAKNGIFIPNGYRASRQTTFANFQRVLVALIFNFSEYYIINLFFYISQSCTYDINVPVLLQFI